MNVLPLFPVTTVGSWPRPPAVLEAQRQLRRGRITSADFDLVADRAVRDVVRLQDLVGYDLITDGELRRDNFSPDRIFLNPDCGFGTFSNRPMNSESVAIEKLRAMTAAARALRG